MTKKIKSIINIKTIIVVLLILLVLSLIILFMVLTTEEKFYRDTCRGLWEAWSQEKTSEKGTHMTAKDFDFIMIELSHVQNYKQKDFKNKSVGEEAKKYIIALEECKKIIEKSNQKTNNNNFWEEFSVPFGKRVQALNNIYKMRKAYFLSIKKSFPDKMDNLLLDSWAIKSTQNIIFKKEKNVKGMESFTAKYMNDSGFDIKYYNIDIELYNKKGEKIDIVSAYVKNWKRGTERKLKFYRVRKDVSSYRIVSEACELLQRK